MFNAWLRLHCLNDAQEVMRDTLREKGKDDERRNCTVPQNVAEVCNNSAALKYFSDSFRVVSLKVSIASVVLVLLLL